MVGKNFDPVGGWAIGPRGLPKLDLRARPSEIGEGLDRPHDIHDAGPGIAGQGGFGLGVPGQGLQRLDARPGPFDPGDEGASERVKIENSIFGLIRDADRFEVTTDHFGRFVVEWQDRTAGGFAYQPAAEVVRQGGRTRLLDATPGFLVSRSQDDPTMIGVKPETIGRQGTDFLGPEPGRQREPVGHRPIRSAQAVALRASISPFDQADQFAVGEVASSMPDILLGVVAGHAQHRVVPQPAIGPCPADERPDAGPVMVHRLQAQAFVLEPCEGGLDLGGLQVVESRRAG